MNQAEATIKPSVLMEEPVKEVFNVPDYEDEERKYLTKLQQRLERAKMLREQPHSEFDDMTYQQYWQKNEDLANVKIKPKLNKQDIQFQSGTLRTKLFAFLSSLQGLNLSGDILAFNKNDILLNNLGNAMEDIIEKTDELDEDEEKKLLRQYELLKHGTVFIEEIWEDKWITEKAPVKNYDGRFRNVKIKTKKVKSMGRPVRNIISGLSVYLGDLRKYLISEQPYIFTAETIRYDEAEKIYGEFENWKFVSKNLKPFSGDSDKAMSSNAWRLMDTKENYVEIIRYQDKPNSEYQIILNAVPMLPLGFPFPWEYDEYNITQQNFKPIRHDFAYGKSFLFENKNLIQLLDEMMKLGLQKTQKSFIPPYINTSGKVITSQALMAGKINMGIQPGQLVPVNATEAQGVTNGEFNMIQELIRTIDLQTASQTFSGGSEGGDVTATQIVELQRQAKIMMGVLITTASLMEKKVIMLRLMNCLKRWFDPIDSTIDKVRGELRNLYRTVTKQTNVEGEGAGVRMVIPTEEVPTPEELMQTEEQAKGNLGMPVRIIALNPKELAKAKLTWVVSVNAREKKSSELSKLMFRAEVQDAMALGLPINPNFMRERFAEVWNEDASKMFEQVEAPAPAASGVTPPPGPETTPTIKRPTVGVGKQNPAAEATIM